ncbi:hypothetical protein LIPSTDRAFT_72351 [Lipomyces starkeyi NRRL Y-11557]|uniref:SWIM-type domain-containing protein n=1 Tax=Lipomyces starkeyi NRRL Y-11557 TaxID=675824 RepID=A0A1E3Q576_LIPST|nr:hypothetical protein LIPSTDRAFT_72351 [Lipomyces starkeyi NRRL Y-11557]
MNTTSRVEGSHAALKRSLSSSSGTLYAAGQRISYRDAERSTQHSIVGATENLFVRVDIRNQLETSVLCTRISRSALELAYTEVLKKVHNQEEDGMTDKCSCTVRSRYLLPCSHQIQPGVPLDVTQIHPRWRVQVSLPVLEVTKQNLGMSVLSQLKDPVVLLKRKGRPRGTRRLQTSAEIAQKAERVRHCGSCHQAGHNRRSCGRLRAESTAMHEHVIVITAGISDIHDRANHQPDAVDNKNLDEDGDGEEDGEEDVEHIVGGSSLTEVLDDVLASL